MVESLSHWGDIVCGRAARLRHPGAASLAMRCRSVLTFGKIRS